MPFIKDIGLRARKAPAATFNNLYAWGGNYYGELGDGTATLRNSPVFITSDVTTVSTGFYSSHFIKNGQLYGTGINYLGQLGDGTTADKSSPVQIGSQTYWYNVSNSVDSPHALFLSDQSGQTKLWSVGNNSSGELGLGDTTPRSSPVQVGTQTDWIYASAGANCSFGIRLDSNSAGTLWSWGFNSIGQLGLGDTTSRSSPTQIGSAIDWIIVEAGNSHVLALANAGTDLYVWGLNNNGNLGLGDTTARNSPVLLASDGYVSVSAGTGHSAVVKADGTLWTWGLNSSGQLGLGNTTARSSPVQVGTGNTWHRVRCGNSHTIAMKTDGTLWAWGNASNGELGIGPTVNRLSPVQVGSLTTWKIAQEIFEVNYFDAGSDHTFAIRDSL